MADVTHSSAAKGFIIPSKNKLTTTEIVLETVKTLLEITWIILCAIFRFFVPAKRKNLDGEIVLITGAAGYIGKRLALRFAKKGAAVVLWDINKNDNEIIAEEIREFGGHAFAYHCNLRDKHDIEPTASKVINDVGNPTILINNAGIVAGKYLMDMTDNDIEATFDVNILSQFWTTRAFLPSMIKKNHGHIVAVASILGTDGLGMLTDYCSTKFAVIGFMQSLRREMTLLGRNNIHCTTVNPFVINAELFQGVSLRFPGMPLLCVLEPDYVADKIIDAVETNQIVLHLPRVCYFTPIISSILPVKACDKLLAFTGSQEAMSTFIGRKKTE
eukprot:gene15349-16925_t